jgi:hypothetical protein
MVDRQDGGVLGIPDGSESLQGIMVEMVGLSMDVDDRLEAAGPVVPELD